MIETDIDKDSEYEMDDDERNNTEILKSGS